MVNWGKLYYGLNIVFSVIVIDEVIKGKYLNNKIYGRKWVWYGFKRVLMKSVK